MENATRKLVLRRHTLRNLTPVDAALSAKTAVSDPPATGTTASDPATV